MHHVTAVLWRQFRLTPGHPWQLPSWVETTINYSFCWRKSNALGNSVQHSPISEELHVFVRSACEIVPERDHMAGICRAQRFAAHEPTNQQYHTAAFAQAINNAAGHHTPVEPKIKTEASSNFYNVTH